MPRGTTLTQGEIRQRLLDLRNKTVLHAAARCHVLALAEETSGLRKTVADLQAENKTLKDRLRDVEETLVKERDALQKLRELLFARDHPHRMRRVRESKPRTAESYRRSLPVQVTEE